MPLARKTQRNIVFINADLSFLSGSSQFVPPSNFLAKATCHRVRFCFDKGGTRNIQERTFRRFPPDRSSFCTLLALLCALDCWTPCNLNPLTPIFCYCKMKVVTFIHNSAVTKNLRGATLQACLNPHHFYKLHLKDIHIHSIQDMACLILIIAKLYDVTIKHRLLCALYMWKVYVRESLSHVIQAYTSSLYKALDTRSENHDAAYTPQAYNGYNILYVISYTHHCAYSIHLLWDPCYSVVLTIICQYLYISVALDFALTSQLTSNSESQQLSHDWHFQGNTRNKMNSREFKISLHLSFDSS